MKDFFINHKLTARLEKIISSQLNTMFTQGDLLYVRNSSKKTKIAYQIINGYPNTTDMPIGEEMEIIAHEAPFMFLGWGSFDEWFIPGTPSPMKVIHYNDFIIGMILLYKNKVWFLTDGWTYEEKHFTENLSQIDLLNEIIPLISKAY